MHIDPPNLPPSPLIDQIFPIIGRTLGFNAEDDTHRMQSCIYPQVGDTCTVEHRPDVDATVEDVPVDSGIGESKVAIEIECALRNASIGGCKDALLAFRSTNDDEDEGGSEDQVDARMSDDLSFGGVGSTRAHMNSIQILWNIPDMAMRSSMLRRRVMRRLTCWLTMLILTTMPCTTIQMGDFMHFFLRSLRVSTPTFHTASYASITLAYSI